MEYKVSAKRYKTCACKNDTLHVDHSDSDSYNDKTFVNCDAQNRYTKTFSTKSIHSERGFVFDMEEEDLVLIDEVGCIIIGQR